MINRIVAFGDSWIYGDELDPENRAEQCIVGQVGKNLGTRPKNIENYGVSGNSLAGTVWEVQRWELECGDRTFKPEETLFVVGLTESSRESWYRNGNYIHNHNVHDRHLWHNFVKHHTVENETVEYQNIKYWQTTEFFYNYCKARGYKLLMVNIFPPPYYSTLVTRPRWNMRDAMNGYENELAPGKHPNKKGCRRIANTLTNIVNSVILHKC
jgi:hypothetical protein